MSTKWSTEDASVRRPVTSAGHRVPVAEERRSDQVGERAKSPSTSSSSSWKKRHLISIRLAVTVRKSRLAPR